jgi:energy-coupling factor transporter ATP-binding protein EcfA2
MARVGVVGRDPDQPASALQAGERQSLAIARALHFGARMLVIDEPTAPMTVAQRGPVLQSVVAARTEGLAVVFVTHSPPYAHLVGDRFRLLAGGQVAGDLTREDVDAQDLTHLVAGGDGLSRLTDSLRAVRPTPGATHPGGDPPRVRRTRGGPPQRKTLTPPGPTSRPTTISTIPHNNCLRRIAKMPATTSTTARIQSNVTMAPPSSMGSPSWRPAGERRA